MEAHETTEAVLRDKVAVVTGAGRGQGRAHAQALAKAGATVVLADLPDSAASSSVPYALSGEKDLAETARLVEEVGGRSLVVPTDIRRAGDVRDLVGTVLARLQRIDVLIANAGICQPVALEAITDAQWDDMVATNLTGTFHCLRAVVPVMRRQGSGRVLVVSSMAGRRGMANLAHYCATKFGVIGMAKAVAVEALADGVTVQVLCPSTVDTPMIHFPENYAVFAPDIVDPTKEQVRERFARLNPMGTPWMEPEDVAQAALAILTQSTYASGAVYELGAGASATLP